jgi:hypothetical protein
MKKGYIIGIILTILGLILSWIMTQFVQGCTGLGCSMSTNSTYIVGIFYIITGIGIGSILTTYMSK